MRCASKVSAFLCDLVSLGFLFCRPELVCACFWVRVCECVLRTHANHIFIFLLRQPFASFRHNSTLKMSRVNRFKVFSISSFDVQLHVLAVEKPQASYFISLMQTPRLLDSDLQSFEFHLVFVTMDVGSEKKTLPKMLPVLQLIRIIHLIK